MLPLPVAGIPVRARVRFTTRAIVRSGPSFTSLSKPTTPLLRRNWLPWVGACWITSGGSLRITSNAADCRDA
jgi:hypothetical protein